ncbi:MAG: YgiT-type zinc finger protein [Cyanobacteria bacterium P01_F01_bin.143]
MRCMYCQGEMKKSTAPFSINRKGYHVRWDAIEAYVCSQCGEPYFEPEAVETIQAAISALEKESKGLIKM